MSQSVVIVSTRVGQSGWLRFAFPLLCALGVLLCILLISDVLAPVVCCYDWRRISMTVAIIDAEFRSQSGPRLAWGFSGFPTVVSAVLLVSMFVWWLAPTSRRPRVEVAASVVLVALVAIGWWLTANLPVGLLASAAGFLGPLGAWVAWRQRRKTPAARRDRRD